eukprot:9397687-Pyramimonas_sp.AAC.1
MLPPAPSLARSFRIFTIPSIWIGLGYLTSTMIVARLTPSMFRVVFLSLSFPTGAVRNGSDRALLRPPRSKDRSDMNFQLSVSTPSLLRKTLCPSLVKTRRT